LTTQLESRIHQQQKGKNAMNASLRIVAVLTLGAALAACAGAGPADPEAVLRNRIGNAAGVAAFDRVEALRYTINVKIGKREIRRGWVWEPGSNRVVLKAEDGGADYIRGRAETSKMLRAVDARFVGDNYWLLFPLHLYWDVDASLTDAGAADLPIGPGSGRRILVSYPEKIGYAPADAYEIFVDEDFRIREWICRKGGAAEPTRITTWEDYRRLGPLTVSLDHRSRDGSFRLWFTDVEVKLKGDKMWRAPK
jgi:hypothetical protein